MSRVEEDEFVDAYLETAFWSSNDESTDEGGEPMDKNYSPADLGPGSYRCLREEAVEYFKSHYDAIADGPGGTEWSQYGMAGHDFWLTRNGHGAGFWDGDWAEPDATTLTDASQAMGEIYLYVGDDGLIYASGCEEQVTNGAAAGGGFRLLGIGVVGWDEPYELGDFVEIATNMDDADFWLQRRGSEQNVGKPHREFSEYDIGLYVQRGDIIQPTWLYYMMEHLWREGYWRQRSRGTLALQHIVVRDVKAIPIMPSEE